MLNFGTTFGQSKLKLHINWSMKTAQNQSIIYVNLMRIE